MKELQLQVILSQLHLSLVESKQALAVLGIDPGSSGAYCLLFPATRDVLFKPTSNNPVDTYAWLEFTKNNHNLAICMIEEVHAIQGSSAKATFNFGGNVREVNLIPQLVQIPIDKVRPKEWQKFIGLVTPKNLSGSANASKRKTYIKKEVSAIASRLYPEAELKGPKGGLLDGRSDALMIAHYAARTLNFE